MTWHPRAESTPTLLPFCVVSRRFHRLILRILHFRLLLAAAAPEYKLILEAFHPTKRYTDPYLFCTYLGTDGLSSKHEGEGSLYEDCATESGRFAKLSSLYSRIETFLGVTYPTGTPTVLALSVFDENITKQISARAGMLKKFTSISDRHEKAFITLTISSITSSPKSMRVKSQPIP